MNDTNTSPHTFFENLFSSILSEGKFLELRHWREGTGKAQQNYFQEVAAFLAECQGQPKGTNYFYGINPRDQRKGTKEAVSCVTAFHADLDFKDAEPPALQAKLKEFCHGPTVVVGSGHGLHAYWMLKEPEQLSFDQRGRFERIQKGLQASLGADPTHDLSRVLRIPGTTNYKNGKATPCKIIFTDYTRRYSISDFEHFHVSEQTPAEPVNGAIPNGERNNTLTSEAGTMQRRGLLPEAIMAALKVENKRRCKPPLSDGELAQIVKSVSRYPSAEKTTERKPIRATCMSDVEPEEVQYLWPPYIPLGKLTMVDGDPGVGKTYITQALAAAVSHGSSIANMTPNTEPANVLLLSAEDGKGDTIRPRLDKVGANTNRIYCYTDPLIFADEGLDLLTDLILAHTPKLIVIDPLDAFLGESVDAFRSNAVRPILARLSSLAERFHCAILLLRHLTKSAQTKAIYCGLASIAFMAAARSALLCGADPNNTSDDTRAVIIHIKHNLSIKGKPIGYLIDKEGYFYWTGESKLTESEILGPVATNEEQTAQAEATEFLVELLSDGPVLSTEVYTQAKQAEISKSTLNRAKYALGIRSRKRGFTDGQWRWTLPEGTHDENLRENAKNRQFPLDTVRGENLRTSSSSKSLINNNLTEGTHDENLHENLHENLRSKEKVSTFEGSHAEKCTRAREQTTEEEKEVIKI